MDEIALFLDKEGKTRIYDSIDFGIVEAGKTTKKSIWIKNKIKFKIDALLSAKAEGVVIEEKSISIPPTSIVKATFLVSPKITTLKPLQGNLNIKIAYVVK